MSVLHLPRPVYDQLRAHGEQTYPDECCGALLGKSVEEGWRVGAAVRATNFRTDSAHNSYEIAPLELVRIEREARREGLEIAAFTTRTPTTRHTGHSLIFLKRIGWAALT